MTKSDKRENIIMVCVRRAKLVSRFHLCHFQIASEPLTFERADWMEIRTNHMAVITPKMNFLQIPIIDEFYVPPSDPAALKRTKEFAQEKGLLNPRKSLPIQVEEDPTERPRVTPAGTHCC